MWGPKGTEEKFLGGWDEWFDIDDQLAHMDKLGHDVDVVCSISPFSGRFLGHGKVQQAANTA